MEENKRIHLRLGPMSESIAVQLKEQGFKFDSEEIKHFQLDADAINRVHVREVMVDYIYELTMGRLSKKIIAHVNKKNKPGRAK